MAWWVPIAVAGGQAINNLASGMISSDKGYGQSKAGAEASWERSIDAYKNRYQWTTEDMRLSGLNPILAAKGGFAVQGSPSSESAQGYAPNIQSPDIAGTALQLSQKDKTEAERDKTKAERLEIITRSKKNVQSITESIAKTQKLKGEKDVMTSTFNLQQQQFFKLAEEVTRIQFEIGEIQTRTDLNLIEQGRLKHQSKEIQANTERLKYLFKTLSAELAQAQKIGGVYKSKYGTILTYLKETLDALNINFGLVGVGAGGKTANKIKGFIGR